MEVHIYYSYFHILFFSWVGKHLGEKFAPKLKNYFKELIRMESRKDYEAELEKRKSTWDPKFKNYWEKHVEPKDEKCCCTMELVATLTGASIIG